MVTEAIEWPASEDWSDLRQMWEAGMSVFNAEVARMGAETSQVDARLVKSAFDQALSTPGPASGNVWLTARWALWRLKWEDPVVYWGGLVGTVLVGVSGVTRLLQ